MPEPRHPTTTPTVLVVAGNSDLADTYTGWLETEYDVRTARSGAAGLTRHDPAVDVVLLDRGIRDLPGATVARRMARRDADDQRVLLASDDPGPELVDLPCDAHLTKPVTKGEVRDTVRELQMRSELDDELQRQFTLTSKIATLKNSTAPGTETAIDDLRREAERVRARVEDRLD